MDPIVVGMENGEMYILHRHLLLNRMFLCFIQPYGTGVSENQAGPAVFPNSAVVAQEGMVDVVLLTGRKEQYAEPSDVVDEMILR